MFLKAISEEYVNNSVYTKVILMENFNKLLECDKKLDQSNHLSNAIMSVVLNRYALKLFTKHDFKKNQDEINKTIDDGEFFKLSIKKSDDFNEGLIRGLEYIDYKKGVLANTCKHITDVDIFVDQVFSFEKINNVIYNLNNILIDNERANQFDYYKAQYILLAFSYLEMNHIATLADFKLLDNYLDALRENLPTHRLAAFLRNAKNYYYHLNPYGDSLPTTRVEELLKLIDEAKYVINGIEDEEIIGQINDLFGEVNIFIERIYTKDIPHYKRLELLSDSDFTTIVDFMKYFNSSKCDLMVLKHEKKILNCIDDVKRISNEVRDIRDGN